MNKIKTLIGLALCALAFTVQAQDTPPPTTTPAPWINSPITDFFSNSNLMVATYGIADVKDHDFGAGIGLAYKLSEFVVPVLRFDYIKRRIWNPSMSLQLQVPVKLFGRFDVIPFVSEGIATPISGGNSFNPISVTCLGAAIPIPATSIWAPKGIIGDIERWTGSGMNSTQYRIGCYWKF